MPSLHPHLCTAPPSGDRNPIHQSLAWTNSRMDRLLSWLRSVDVERFATSMVFCESPMDFAYDTPRRNG